MNGHKLNNMDKNKSAYKLKKLPSIYWLNLDSEEQRMVVAYFDHLFNRIIDYSDDPGMKVNCPYNFNTPDGWAGLLDSIGAPEVSREYLGVDQPLADIYHTIHVGRVR